MKDEELEQLLWEVGRESPNEETPSPSTDELRRYRAGELSESETEELEARLALSPEGQERLMDLAGYEAETAPQWVREKLVERFAKSPKSTPKARSGRAWWASAAVAAGLLLAILLPDRGPDSLPPGLAFDLTVQGNAEVRSGDGEPYDPSQGAIEVDPDTELRIAATPREAAKAGLELGLYRVDESAAGKRRLLRLGPKQGLRVEPIRGGAIFSGRGEELLGAEPGSRLLLLSVSKEGDLPREVAVEPGQAPESTLAAEGRRLVFPIPIQLLASAADAAPADAFKGSEP